MIRLISHRVLVVLAVPIVFLGLIDPLEGGIALLVAGLIYAIAFLLVGKGPKKYLWIPYISSIAVGAIVLLMVIAEPQRFDGDGLPGPVIVGLWIYSVAVLLTLAGSITTAILSFRKAS